jgi:tRNA(Ile)-lysidine synthase
MWREIIQNLKNKQDEGYILACSGGMDSMFLYHFLKNNKIPFIVGHFDHCIRETSGRDRNFVIDMCIRDDIDISVGQGHDIKNEKDAREQRYTFLRELAKNTNKKHILTAHHFDDQIETVIFRLLRGIPHKNLTMRKKNGYVYRPLLNVSRSDIETQVKHRKIDYVDDETNFTSQYDRGFIRNEVIPMLESRWNIKKAMRHNCEVNL